MHIGLYTDPHISMVSSIIVGKQGNQEFSGRLQNLVDSFKWMNNLFKEHCCEKIFCLGDMTDKPNLTAEEITALSRCNVQEHNLIIGNHCRADKDGMISSLSLFKNIYYEPTVIPIPKDNGGYYNIFILPYNSDIRDLTPYKTPPFDLILSHNDIKGYDFGGHISESGYELSDILQACNLFINGHLHNGGWLVKDRIINLGVLSGVNFASCNGEWEPSVAILDTETGKLELFENPIAYKFKKLEVLTLPKLKAYLDNLPGTNYVIQVKVPEDIAQTARKVLDQSSKVSFSRVLTQRNTNKENQESTRDIITTTSSVYQKLREFITSKNPKEYSHDKLEEIINKIEKEEGVD